MSVTLRERLMQQWADCRWGIVVCDTSPVLRDKLLEWMAEDDHWATELWARIILCDDIAGRDFVLSNPIFPFDEPQAGYWRQMATSSPFPILRRLKERMDAG